MSLQSNRPAIYNPGIMRRAIFLVCLAFYAVTAVADETETLRRLFAEELGAKFDIRAFHDEVLGAGPVPLSMLDERVSAWIAAEKRR
jgi:hypothetical protein